MSWFLEEENKSAIKICLMACAFVACLVWWGVERKSVAAARALPSSGGPSVTIPGYGSSGNSSSSSSGSSISDQVERIRDLKRQIEEYRSLMEQYRPVIPDSVRKLSIEQRGKWILKEIRGRDSLSKMRKREH